jgi:hypothetical protein
MIQQSLFCDLFEDDSEEKRHPILDVPLNDSRPLILNWGAGVDSTAMACGLRERQIIPDLVIFADTGGEKEATYEWVRRFPEIMRSWGFPEIVTVRYSPVRATYDNLYDNCWQNRTLPSLAFGYGKCSLKFKGSVMDNWIRGVSRGKNKKDPWAPYAAAAAEGIKPTKLIGYDAGPKDSRRKVSHHEDEHWFFRYPLREWDWDRKACVEVIRRHGMAVPAKSSCTYCPAMKPHELVDLFDTEPDKFLQAMQMEARALPGLEKVEGLWRNTRKGDGRSGSWVLWAESEGMIRVEREMVTRAFNPKSKKEADQEVRTFEEITHIELLEIRTEVRNRWGKEDDDHGCGAF